MKRIDLEHLIRAAAAITGESRLIVLGSQSILGSFPNAPAEFLISQEADLVLTGNPNQVDLIAGSIGEESPFHKAFGYYAQGLSLDIAILPEGWRDRLVPVYNENTGGATGLCLEVHDLAISKLAAGREKDVDFVRGLLRHKLVSSETLFARLLTTQLDDSARTFTTARLKRIVAGA